jgi:2-methylisocitrate lyase-like PEP mutase family enzyme
MLCRRVPWHIYPAACNNRYKPGMPDRPDARDFRPLLKPGAAVVLPGVSNALAARVVADLGFPAAYITGAGIANTFLGIPDNGLVTLSELASHVAAIREVFGGPLMVDADTGFGNAVNMVRTVKLLERAGADAIQIEDQVFPKRCGHFDGKAVIPAAEMVAKVKAAVDARSDTRLLIVARTDAIATDGFTAAIERARAYREAGADMTFVEAPQSLEEIAEIPRLLPWPQIINIVLGGRTPELPNAKLAEFGYAAVLYANVALQSALRGMQEALSVLRRDSRMGEATKLAATFAERQRLVGKAEYDALEQKYRTD